ncbi:hypothetical protein DCE93_01745 [Agromyces badenianii]|uniref:Uncharacterized protein n=1 Tax=Agromyces badenianii TaxID=2080742 RepID=A0A2S0WTC2_9MICO|nr:hypothetical protein [Agromyces badenianii]AWB94548.1 hypothetical protein DCE93_01745 [Agromyces badenianii]PWC03662.1 hypothetical protein DCE94_11685 [Agromyces badenianii]
MERILYAGHDFATATVIAEAVLDYAGELAAVGRYATVAIPIIAMDGAPSTARLLLGPSLPIATKPIQGPAIELVDDGAVAELRDATRRLRPSHDVHWAVDPGGEQRMADEFDYDPSPPKARELRSPSSTDYPEA